MLGLPGRLILYIQRINNIRVFWMYYTQPRYSFLAIVGGRILFEQNDPSIVIVIIHVFFFIFSQLKIFIWYSFSLTIHLSNSSYFPFSSNEMNSNQILRDSPVSEHNSASMKRPTDNSQEGDDSKPKKARYSEDNNPELPRQIEPGTQGISTYDVNDVLCGRGGGTNQHYGNIVFRNLVDTNREKYLRSKKNDKPFISRWIVKAIRDRNGRFLKRDEASGLYYDIGDNEAREKASQALRQRAPERKRELEEKDKILSKSSMVHSSMADLSSIIDKNESSEAASKPSILLSQYLFERGIWQEIVALRQEQAQLQKELLLARQGKSSGNYPNLLHSSSA